MPHGGGHAGGGHHGGGGFHHHHHGGGYHHHHRHLHHHGGGWGWGWGWPYGGYRRGYRGWGYSGVGITIFIVVVLVIVVLSVRYTGGEVSGDNNDNYYSPGATIIVSYASALCSSLTLDLIPSYFQPGPTGASLYLFPEKPPLSSKDHFVIDGTNTDISGSYYKYWSFYLYPSSGFKLDVCIDESAISAPVYFYLIKGSSNLNAWSDDPDDSDHTLRNLKVTALCSSGNATVSGSISSEGEYYFVLYNDDYTDVDVNAYLTIDRVKYSVNSSASVSNCSVTSDGASFCSIPISLSSQYTALLAVDSPSDNDYSQNIEIDVSCAARVWMYAVIVAAPTVFVILLIVFTVVCCVCVLRYRRRMKERSSPTVITGDPLPGNENAPLVTGEPPPAYNPNYPPGQVDYGTQSPPAYK